MPQKAVFTVTGRRTAAYFDRNLEILKAVISCAEKSAKDQKAEEKAKTNMLSSRNSALTAMEAGQLKP